MAFACCILCYETFADDEGKPDEPTMRTLLKAAGASDAEVADFIARPCGCECHHAGKVVFH